MEKYNLEHDLKVFGVHVKTFPNGIGEAFDGLIKMLPQGDERYYYGISECTNKGIIYKATALETFEGEGEKYGCENYLVEKGEYLAVTVSDWLRKTNCIKNVFEEIFQDDRVDRAMPCIEVYKNMNEMMCMVKIDRSKEIFGSIETVTYELLQTFSSFKEEQINSIPFAESWTAGQLAEHLIKSNTAVAKALNAKGKTTEREPDERVLELKDLFLNFNNKFKSPDVVLPTENIYKKETVIHDLKKSIELVRESSKTVNLTETADIPGFGELTKLELLHFVLFHTQRHMQQLKNIYNVVENIKIPLEK